MKTQSARLIERLRRFHIQGICRNTLALPFRRHITQRPVFPRVRHRKNDSSIAHHKHIGRRIRRWFRCGRSRRRNLLSRGRLLPGAISLHLCSLELFVNAALIRSLLSLLNRLRILNNDLRRRNQKPAKPKRHRLPKSPAPSKLRTLRPHRRQMRVVKSQTRHVIRNKSRISKPRIRRNNPVRRRSANTRTARNHMCGHSNVIHRMRSRRSTHACYRNRRSNRARPSYRASAQPASPLRKTRQRQRQHYSRDYANSSHSNTMPLPNFHNACTSSFTKKDAPCPP
jgi:hypothetical protein